MNAITRIALIVLCFGILLPLALSQEISVTRTISPISAVNQEFSVTLAISVGTTDPSGLIISETIPVGWTIVSADESCVINASKRLIKCVRYGDTLDDPLIYRLKSPAQNPPRGELIGGNWQTVSQTGVITGGVLEIREPVPAEPQAPTPRPPDVTDNTLLYVAGGVILLLLIIAGVWIASKRSTPKTTTAK